MISKCVFDVTALMVLISCGFDYRTGAATGPSCIRTTAVMKTFTEEWNRVTKAVQPKQKVMICDVIGVAFTGNFFGILRHLVFLTSLWLVSPLCIYISLGYRSIEHAPIFASCERFLCNKSVPEAVSAAL
jgi:hypothetical protein